MANKPMVTLSFGGEDSFVIKDKEAREQIQNINNQLIKVDGKIENIEKLQPETATVGHILEVASIDENGKPLTYRAIENKPDIEVDDTLSIEGKAADAKATGEALKNISVDEELTLEEYKALSEEEKNSDKTFYIKDANFIDEEELILTTAKNIAFDNTNTGLESTDTQEVIVEVDNKVKTIENKCGVAELETEAKTYSEAINEVNTKAKNGGKNLVGDEFDEAKTYAVGDYCIYENVLYVFISAKTAGAWDSTLVEATTVEDELSELNKNMDNYLPLSGGTVTGDVSFNKSLLLGNEIDDGTIIKAKQTDGVYQNVLSMGGNNNISLGAGLYNNGDKATYIYGGKNIFMLLPVDGVPYGVVLQNGINDAAPTAFRPEVTEGTYLGMASKKWHTIYAKTGTVNTSDEREKENIIPMGASSVMTLALDGESEPIDIYSELFDRLIPVEYNFIDVNDGRTYFGLVAQQVVSAMEEVCFEENELDLVHHEYYTDEETGEEKDTYGINYNNLIALLIHEVQKLKAEVDLLKAE